LANSFLVTQTPLKICYNERVVASTRRSSRCLAPAVPPCQKLTETLLSADPSNGVVFKDMLRLRSRFLLTLSILAAAADCAVAADQPPAPQDSKKAVPSPAKEPAKKLAADDRTGAKTADSTNGVVVFIDPATGQIRQPDASEIGGLVTPSGPAPKAPTQAPALIQGTGGAVGARLSEDSRTYMVVSAAPDGKLAMDCVTGEKAAAARVTTTPATKAKETPADPKHPQVTQDTHDVKVPR
jgi:hypothetical protein